MLLQTYNIANLAVFPQIWACFFVQLRVFLKTCGWLVFGLVLTEIYSTCFLGLFFADFCFSDCFFFKFYGNFMFQFAHKGILGVFLWKCGHFGFVFRICHHVFLLNLPADFSFCCIFLLTHVGLVFRSKYLFLACFSYFLACFCKITWHHWDLDVRNDDNRPSLTSGAAAEERQGVSSKNTIDELSDVITGGKGIGLWSSSIPEKMQEYWLKNEK